jgi:hypothetical protein
MNTLPMILALLLGIGYALELREKLISCPDTDHIQAHVFVLKEYIFKLVFAQQTIVHEYAKQVRTYGSL